AVGELEVAEVVPAEAGHGPRAGVVDEERGVGLGQPRGLVAGVGAADALIEVAEEPADEGIRLEGGALLASRHAARAAAMAAAERRMLVPRAAGQARVRPRPPQAQGTHERRRERREARS